MTDDSVTTVMEIPLHRERFVVLGLKITARKIEGFNLIYVDNII